MGNSVYSPKVRAAIEAYFDSAGMNQISIAKALEISPQAVSQQLRLPFGKRAANKWAKQFGFDAEFLMTGNGSLVPPPDLLPEEKRIYSDSLKKQEEIQNEGKEMAGYGDPNDADMEKETEYLLSLNIDDLVENQEWDTTEDYNKALEIRDVFWAQIQEVSVDLEFSERNCQELKEEIKRLRLENMSLRRKIQANIPNKTQ